jgi:hypothetical protein
MRSLCAIVLILCAVGFSGCSSKPVMTTTSSTPTNQVNGTALNGRVHGGQQPIVGAKVYLYAVDATGYGQASDSLLKSPGYVTTDGSGNFSITGDYTCPGASAQVYLYSNGGDPTPGVPNAAAGLLAGLGSCGTLSSQGAAYPFIYMNEVSTIATAYALAGYATDSTHISSSGTTLALTGVANAFAAIPNLETLSTGMALATTPASGGSVPQGRINTLANILAACINSSGPLSGPCTTLLSNALSGGTTGTQPTDTATAAINIAHNPIANLANLFALQTATSPFIPDLSAAPGDFTISIVISGGSGSEFGWPEYPAIDASGNVWVTNGQAYCCINGEVAEFNNTGVNINTIQYFGFGMAYPMGIAIDASGNAWTANLSGSVAEISSSGTVLSPVSISGSGWKAGGLVNGYGIAIDANGNVWAGDSQGGDGNPQLNNPHSNGHGTALVEFSSSGSALSGASGFTGGGINGPLGVAVDIAGNIWTANSGTWTISEFNGSTGAAISPSGGYTGGGLNDPYTIAVGNGPLIWTANENNSSWSLFSDTGTADSGSSGYSGDGVSNPFSLALDGAGNLWIPSGNGTVEEFGSGGPISGSSGYSDGYTGAYVGIAVDGSGNVWIVRPNGTGGASTGSLTEFVGAATPVVTPIVANLKTPYGSQPVNKP